MVNPSASPITQILAHPLLHDQKFVAAACGLVILLFLWTVLSGKKSRGRDGVRTVLLAGPLDGGKTSLFTKLVYGVYPLTHTSIVPSDTTFALPSPYDHLAPRRIRLIDLPGHPRLRDELQKYVQGAAAVVFVVDIQALVRNASAVAAQLLPILTALANVSTDRPGAHPVKLLLLAHKTDRLIRATPAPTPKPTPAPTPTPTKCPPDIPEPTQTTSVDRLKSLLTREMDRLKSTRSATGGKIEGIASVSFGSVSFWARLFGSAGSAGGGGAGADADGDTDADETLVWGNKGPFRWDDVEGVEVRWGASALGEVIGGAGESGGNGLDVLLRFLWDV